MQLLRQRFRFRSSKPRVGVVILVHFDAFIKHLAPCLQPVAKMHFVQLSPMLNLKCLDKKQGGAGGWNKGWVSNCEVLGPVVTSPLEISTFSTHFLKKWLQGRQFPGHITGKKQKIIIIQFLFELYTASFLKPVTLQNGAFKTSAQC